MYNPLPFRPYVAPNSSVMVLIAKGHCWHFDAWMRCGSDGTLYVHIETRSGGRELLTRTLFTAMHGTLYRMGGAVEPVIDQLEPVTLQDKALWPRYAELNEIHWRDILPLAGQPPRGFRSRSVALHYIRAPSLDPLADDVLNMHHYERNV